MKALVLDKNYLQGAKADSIVKMRETYRLLMPDALFFEMISTDDESRWKIFSKLPDIENPVALVEGMGEMLRYELENLAPSGKPSTRTIDVDFRFHEGLKNRNFELPAYVKESIAEENEELKELGASFLSLIETVPSIFPLPEKPWEKLTTSDIASCEETIAEIENGAILARSTLKSDGSPLFPETIILNADWIVVRRMQVLALFALDYYRRHGPIGMSTMTPRQLLTLEHDLHDMQILILGVAENALATHERKLRTWFRLLAPNGLLLPEDTPAEKSPTK